MVVLRHCHLGQELVHCQRTPVLGKTKPAQELDRSVELTALRQEHFPAVHCSGSGLNWLVRWLGRKGLRV